MGLPLNQLRSGLHQALQPPPEPEQTVQVLNPGTALIGHTFEVYDRQFSDLMVIWQLFDNYLQRYITDQSVLSSVTTAWIGRV